MILYRNQLLKDLKLSTVFLDTNVFSVVTRSKDLSQFIELLKNTGCSLTTIRAVVFEISNGSDTLAIYNERVDLISSIVDSVDPMRFLSNIEEFSFIMSKLNAKNKSYTDFLLASCLYHYKASSVYLMTSDFEALPTFFENTDIITVTEKSGKIRNFGLYKFNHKNYTKAVNKILKP